MSRWLYFTTKGKSPVVQGLLAETSEDEPEVVCPNVAHPCPINHEQSDHETSDWDRERHLYEGERIRITVGGSIEEQERSSPNSTGSRSITFLVHKGLLVHYSGYFKAALRGDCFLEARSGEFDLPDDDPEEFRRWVHWLYSCDVCKILGPVFSRTHICGKDKIESPWCGGGPDPETALVFADRILCAEYYSFVLGHFIQHVHLAGPERLVSLTDDDEDRNGEGPLLRDDTPAWRFLRDWRAYLSYLKLHGYDLSKAEQESRTASWPSRDPRLFEMEHWEEACSEGIINNPKCEHASHLRWWENLEMKLEDALNKAPRGPPFWRKREWWTRVGFWASYPAAGIWFLSLFAIGGLGSYLYSQGHQPGLISREARIFGLTVAIFIPGTVFPFLAAVVALPPWHWVFKPAKIYIFGMVAFGFGSGIYSSYLARKCFLEVGNSNENKNIWKVQTAFSSCAVSV